MKAYVWMKNLRASAREQDANTVAGNQMKMMSDRFAREETSNLRFVIIDDAKDLLRQETI